MTKLEFLMRDILLFVPFVPPLEQNKCYPKDSDAVSFNSRLKSSPLHISRVCLVFPSAPSPLKPLICLEESDVLFLLKVHVFL